MITHSQYDPWPRKDKAEEKPYDIALLRLKKRLNLGKHTPPCFHSWKKWEPGNPVPRLFLQKFRNFREKKLARKFGGTLVSIKFGQQIQK